jgi:hypothetical protein
MILLNNGDTVTLQHLAGHEVTVLQSHHKFLIAVYICGHPCLCINNSNFSDYE